jgi:ATP-binding cassette subfamily C protein CydC
MNKPMRRPLFRLLALIGTYWRWMLLAAILGFCTVASSIFLMAAAAYIIARAALQPSIADLEVAVVGVRFFGIARGVFRYLERYISHEVTFRLLARLRVWFYRALEPLAPARLMQYRGGDLLARILGDIEALQHFYGRVIAPPAVALLIGLLMAFFMGAFDPALALTLLLFLAVAGVAVPILVFFLGREPGRQVIRVRAALNVALVDGIQGMSEIVAFGGQADRLAQVRALSRQLAVSQKRLAWIGGLNNALGVLLIGLATLAILVVAIPLVNAARLSGVDLAVVALATMASFEAVLPLALAAQYLESNLEAARRLFEIVDVQPEVRDPAQPAPPPAQYGIAFEQVRFRYAPGEPPALDGISFDLPPGKRVAVVGPSGAGKSTLLNLLLRFWEAQEGRVTLGGRDLRSYAGDDLRRLIGVVAQNTHLFNATIRENLLLAQRDADEDALIRAAQGAQIHDFILSLPGGYETWIGEGGVRLSGGERQRLAIARALLKGAPVLVLDEATANLDTVTEAEVLRAVRQLMENRTTLIITHRLVALESVDEILVLQAGRIVERGSLRDLLQAGGFFRRMWDLQHQVFCQTIPK